MQYLFILAALTAFAAALPFQQPRSDEKCPEEYPQYQDVMRNQSSVFALQFIASALSNEEVDQACNQLSADGGQQWSQLGLYPAIIQNTTCNAQGSRPNASLALPDVVAANTQIFTTQIVNSFASTNQSSLKYLCNNLRYAQLSGFLLDDATIINATCVASDALLSPPPFTTGPQINQSAVAAYHDAASKLYAYQYASQACSAADLNLYCAHAPAHHASWTALQLNAALVEATLCGLTQPLSPDATRAAMAKWTTKQFLAVLENASDAEGYRRWLCDALDVDAMDRVALDGAAVKRAACQQFV